MTNQVIIWIAGTAFITVPIAMVFTIRILPIALIVLGGAIRDYIRGVIVLARTLVTSLPKLARNLN